MTLERYHGSTARAAISSILDPLGRRLRRVEWAWAGKDDADPEVSALLRRAAHVKREEALRLVDKAAGIAAAKGNARAQREVGQAFVRLGDPGRGLSLSAPTLEAGDGTQVWAGEDLRGRSIRVCQRTAADMGGALRLARFIRQAAREAASCTALVEERLVPLFRRTFPDVEVLPMETARPGPANFVTSFEALGARYGRSWDEIAAALMPLQPDGEKVRASRRRYQSDPSMPLVGICWGSKNSRKDVPTLAAWASLIERFPATFVSLQYGSVAPALKKLRGRRPERLIDDPQVDQMKDMDAFAAQIAALDAVVAISGTAAHLAGALDISLILVRDDRFAGVWPIEGDVTGWYPSGAMVRRRQRDWPEVFEEVAERLSGQLARRK